MYNGLFFKKKNSPDELAMPDKKKWMENTHWRIGMIPGNAIIYIWLSDQHYWIQVTVSVVQNFDETLMTDDMIMVENPKYYFNSPMAYIPSKHHHKFILVTLVTGPFGMTYYPIIWQWPLIRIPPLIRSHDNPAQFAPIALTSLGQNTILGSIWQLDDNK